MIISTFGKYFTREDLEVTTHELHEPNLIPEEQIEQGHWQTFLTCWIDPLNEWLEIKHGEGIRISSGFRSPELNAIVSGKPKSQHQGIPYAILGEEVLACAVDLQWQKKQNTKDEVELLFNEITAFLRYDQCGKEHTVSSDGTRHWVHLSAFPFEPRLQRNMVFVV